MKKKIVVIGAGFAGIAAATSLASQGYHVTLLEKNKTPGGRARAFSAEGFIFDMGPSWYWMPDVFEKYFNKFGKSAANYYALRRLDPSYAVFFGKSDVLSIPANLPELYQLFEQLEKGSSKALEQFLKQAAYKYEVGINQLVYKPGQSLREFASLKLLFDMLRLDVFSSFHRHIRKFFRHSKILQLMEFPILFLGAVPQNTPALYSLMNYADIQLGTWYPMGGMHEIIKGMVSLAEEMGVEFRYDQNVKEVTFLGSHISQVVTQSDTFEAQVVVNSADYHHFEQQILPATFRTYSEKYWQKRTMAPSSLLFYLGINKKLKGLEHHNLFFDRDFMPHAREIYEHPQWPSDPLFYVSAPSRTDPSVAPEACENLFVLMPVAPGLKDTEEIREKYFQLLMSRLEELTGQAIRPHVIYQRSYAHQNFIQDYNAFKGNAYGLANTLRQTAILKPSLRSKKIRNLFYTGQLTVPGPGVPPSLISGQLVATEIMKEF